MLPDDGAPSYFIGPGFDDRNAVGVEVADHQFATVWFERQVDRCTPYVEQSQYAVAVRDIAPGIVIFQGIIL